MKRTESRRQRGNRISVWNWMGTLVLSAIPGVNIIAWILMIIFAKRQPKRSFAIAALVLTVLCLALVVAAFFLFGDQLTEYSRKLAESVYASPIAETVPAN